MTHLIRAVALAVVVAVASLQAATVTILTAATRGSLSIGHVGDAQPTPVHVAAGTPANNGNYNFTITSSVWPTTPGLTMRVIVERSLDGGATWNFMMGNDPNDPADHFISNEATKDGSGLIKFGTVWDGSAMDLRGTFTVNQSFNWGISASF